MKTLKKTSRNKDQIIDLREKQNAGSSCNCASLGEENKMDEASCNSTSINNVVFHVFHFIEAFSCMGVQVVATNDKPSDIHKLLFLVNCATALQVD